MVTKSVAQSTQKGVNHGLETYHAMGEFGKKVSESVSRKEKLESFKRMVKRYIDDHSSVLLAPHPGHRLYFRESDATAPLEIFGVTETEVMAAIRQHRLADPTWKATNKPIFWVLSFAARQCAIQKDEQALEHVLAYMACAMYSGIQYKYWQYETKGGYQSVMDYTVNNLSGKFILKEKKNNIAAAVHTTKSAFENAPVRFGEQREARLASGADGDVRYFISQVWCRINGYMQSIAREYYANLEKGNRLYRDKEPEEDSGRTIDNASLAVSRISEAAFNRAQAAVVDRQTLKMAVGVADVSETATAAAIEKIVKEMPALVKELVSAIVQIYLADGSKDPESIASSSFLGDCLREYTKSNSKDPKLLRIRDILDTMLRETSPKYVSTERAATQGNFRKAVYVYFVVITMKAARRE